MAKAQDKASKRKDQAVTNRKAYRDYEVIETVEAGIALAGTEIKSIRNGHVTMTGSFASAEDGELILRDLHINPYEYGNQFNHEPTRPRRLLLHKREIEKLSSAVTRQGLTLVPLKIYFKRGRAKVALGLCRGKQQHDKRDDMRKKTTDRETARAIASRGRE